MILWGFFSSTDYKWKKPLLYIQFLFVSFLYEYDQDWNFGWKFQSLAIFLCWSVISWAVYREIPQYSHLCTLVIFMPVAGYKFCTRKWHDQLPGTKLVPGSLIHTQDAALLLHSAHSFIQTGRTEFVWKWLFFRELWTIKN